MKTKRPSRTELKSAAARYLKIVEWSDEDKCFVGRCPSLFLGGCHGSDETKVHTELCELVEEHVAELMIEGLETVLSEETTAPSPADALARLRQGYHLGGQPLAREQTHAR